jgi:hypothetical protein
MAAPGPDPRFAAKQRDVGNRGQTGRSADEGRSAGFGERFSVVEEQVAAQGEGSGIGILGVRDQHIFDAAPTRPVKVLIVLPCEEGKGEW